jgi:heat shock protein HslJ
VLSLAGCGDEAGLTAAGEENPLATTTWTLVSYLDDAGDRRAAVESAPSTLAFGDDGFVTGNTGCNSFRGSCEPDGDRLSVASTVTTRAACVSPDATGTGTCSPEQTEVGADLLAALTAATTYRISGNKLTLRDDAGSTQVTLLRR